jgi:uncharacterized protein (DUF885 family)
MNHDPSRRQLLELGAAGVLLGAAPWLGGCASRAEPPPGDASQAFDTWSERLAEDWLRLAPEATTSSRYFTGDEQRRLDGQLSGPASEVRAARQALARQALAALDGPYALERLDARRQVSARILRFSFERQLASARFEDHFFSFNQFGGLQVRYSGLLAEAQPLRERAHIGPLLDRLGAMHRRIDSELDRTRAAAARGLLPPRFIVERARGQLRQLIEAPLADEPVINSLTRRLARIEGLPEAERQAALDTARGHVEQQVRPAWARVAAWMDEALPRTTDDAGLWRLPDGDAAYVQALAANTTTTLGPDAVHELGLAQVARLEAEMERVLRGLGHHDGTIAVRLNNLQRSLQPAAEPDPRPGLIARYQAYIRDAERRADALFNLRPRAGVEVQRVGALTERTAAASYSQPAADGSRPGVFWVPLPGPVFSILGMRTLAIHEAVPGHHFQIALQQEQAELPRWRQLRAYGGGTAFVEGWALYAEQLAIDHGWYAERVDGGPGADAHGLLGALNAQLFRARRLVVDTGLHARRWTRQQAIDYGISPSEVERYVVMPGQACAYMVGKLRIQAARDAARQRLGPRFELKAFHDLVLRTGSVPLDVLDEVLRAWPGRAA